MSTEISLSDRIFWIGVNDRQTALFEELWPIPDGIAYNSYMILDDKVAIIDAVKDISMDRYLEKIRRLLGERRHVDYLIINHIEPDHSGGIKILREAYPDMEIVGNKKTLELLAHFYGITHNVRMVNDYDTLELGSCRLKFFLTPMVHWPETMMTYEETRKLLFSGDAFGGFGSLDNGIFDDEIRDLQSYEDEMLRYFTNVIAKYSVMVQKAISKIKDLDIAIVASTHGPVWRTRPRHAIDLYDRWSRQEAEEGFVIVYASMYGNTEKMMEAIGHALAAEKPGIIRIHNVSRSHASYIIADIWRYRAVIVGSPAYNMGLFPLMDHLLRLIENKGLKDRLIGLFGSYGWSGGAMKELTDFVGRMKWQLIEPAIEVKGSPTEEDLRKCRLLGSNMAQRLRT
ncbi:MAG: FprA family A-type flavoprotein [Nitrospirae bacterium]|nr:FprA family A-type flavoprotein [Nitrospirota bacterium]